MKQKIKQLIEQKLTTDGLFDTGISGISLFRVTDSIPCAPAIYEPTIVVIVSGQKEAILEGHKYIYNSDKYLCCAVSLPVEAGSPHACAQDPLLGVYITLDTKVMARLALELESALGANKQTKQETNVQGLSLATWDEDFAEALYRLLSLQESPSDLAILQNARLREFYYRVLKGSAGSSMRQAFDVGNEIARSIEFLSTRLHETITIEALAKEVGMSRAVFHRKFKLATKMSPIQFIKAMRLNHAAMKISHGVNVSQAALAVGYSSSSQFSREFKRMYGSSPKQWSQTANTIPTIN